MNYNYKKNNIYKKIDDMTKDNNNLNWVGQLKSQLNTPKTETRIVLETQDLYPDLAIKKSKLSPAARAKVVNKNQTYQTQNQDSYGPCSYYGCDWPSSVPFEISISIEGCKWWATSYETSLPGYWERSPTGQYYWREKLESYHIGHAYDANSLMGQNSLYTVNTTGLRATENYWFCKDAQRLISECIEVHQKAKTPEKASINVSKAILSHTTGATRWGIKAGVVAGSALIPGAGPAIAIAGGATWIGSEIVKSACDSDKIKHIWGMISDAGKEALSNELGKSVDEVIGVLSSGLEEGCVQMPKSEIIKAIESSSHSVGEYSIKHLIHEITGDRDSDCPLCD